MTDQVLQQEDTVSADRKVRIIFDPRTGKSRKITSVMHRQNFNNAKYGNRKDKDDKDEDNGDKDEKQVKEEKSQIKFVTGNDAIATHVGQDKMKKDKVKKIAEAVVKKALNQISIDKNVGIKEIPTNESTNENANDMVNESNFNNASYSHIRSLARKALAEDRGEDYEYETHRQRELDDKADAEYKKKKKVTTYQVTGSKYEKHGPEHATQAAAMAHRDSLKGHPDHKNMGIHTIHRVVESWEPEKEAKKPNDKVDAELKAAAKKNSAALDKISAAFAKKKVNEEAVLDELINEVLSADAAASDWIHDFVHSDNPKFAGKSKAKRKEMALAAYYSKQRNEEVEQIDELKKSTLGSYIQKASASAAEAGNEAGFKAGAKQPKYNTSDTTHTEKKRAAGIATAVKKLTKEGVEQIDELSKTTLGDYVKKANKEAASKILSGATKGNNKDLVGASKDFGKAAKRNAGVNKAVDKLTKEGTEMNKLTFKQFVEQLDEMVEFVVTNEDVEQILEYTPGAGGVTRVQGKSYGASYHDPEGDDDADDKPAAKPAAAPAPAAKKGRGRPAGSYGSYKARSAETRAAAAAKSAASKAANKAAK